MQLNRAPVEVADGDGREGHGGRRDERVGGHGRVEAVIVDYDHKTSHGEDGACHEDRGPVESSEVKPQKVDLYWMQKAFAKR